MRAGGRRAAAGGGKKGKYIGYATTAANGCSWVCSRQRGLREVFFFFHGDGFWFMVYETNIAIAGWH